MKRFALLAATALGAACGSSSAPPPVQTSGDNVIVYWTFQHLDSTGTPQSLGCAQAGVDTVDIAFSDGYTETVPCSQGGVAGVTVPSFAPGSYWVTATGYRTGVTPALYYSGQVSFTKVAGADAVVYADVPGVASALELFPVLEGWNGSSYQPYTSPSCTNAAIDTLTYVVKDGAGITLAQGQESCAAGYDPASILFSGAYAIDLDTLSIRMRGWLGGALVMDSCTTFFDHFGNDTGSYGPTIGLYYPIPSSCP